MRALVDDAHDRGMKVYFDIVLNHTGDVISYEEGTVAVPQQDHRARTATQSGCRSTTATTPAATRSPSSTRARASRTPRRSSTRRRRHRQGAGLAQRPRRCTTTAATRRSSGENSLYGDFFGLDDLFTEHPDVVDGMIDIHTVDDRARSTSTASASTPSSTSTTSCGRSSCRPSRPRRRRADFALFGEVFDSNPAFLSRFSTELPFPSTLDFRFNGTVRASSPARRRRPTACATLFADDDWFTDADSNALGPDQVRRQPRRRPRRSRDPVGRNAGTAEWLRARPARPGPQLHDPRHARRLLRRRAGLHRRRRRPGRPPGHVRRRRWRRTTTTTSIGTDATMADDQLRHRPTRCTRRSPSSPRCAVTTSPCARAPSCTAYSEARPGIYAFSRIERRRAGRVRRGDQQLGQSTTRRRSRTDSPNTDVRPALSAPPRP